MKEGGGERKVDEEEEEVEQEEEQQEVVCVESGGGAEADELQDCICTPSSCFMEEIYELNSEPAEDGNTEDEREESGGGGGGGRRGGSQVTNLELTRMEVGMGPVWRGPLMANVKQSSLKRALTAASPPLPASKHQPPLTCLLFLPISRLSNQLTPRQPFRPDSKRVFAITERKPSHLMQEEA